jgi:predicted DNA-binding protein YlxM (UPF0122 family)
MTKEDIEIQAINDYFNSRKSLLDVARNYGYTGSWLLKKLKARNIKTRNNSEWRIDKQKQMLACQYYKENMPVKEIASRLSISRRTVTEWLKNNGIRPLNFNERLGVTDDKKNIAKDLYINHNLNCVEISKIVGVSNRAVFDWIKDFKRSRSEISAILSMKGKKIGYGKKGRIETRFGELRYDSSYERDRIIMLEKDANVVNVSRCHYIIKYAENHTYNPDFIVEYANGDLVVEEIKPYELMNNEINTLKFNAAKPFFASLNIPFIIVTQKEIYGK